MKLVGRMVNDAASHVCNGGSVNVPVQFDFGRKGTFGSLSKVCFGYSGVRQVAVAVNFVRSVSFDDM